LASPPITTFADDRGDPVAKVGYEDVPTLVEAGPPPLVLNGIRKDGTAFEVEATVRVVG
jgi:hypothetical protein